MPRRRQVLVMASLAGMGGGCLELFGEQDDGAYEMTELTVNFFLRGLPVTELRSWDREQIREELDGADIKGKLGIPVERGVRVGRFNIDDLDDHHVTIDGERIDDAATIPEYKYPVGTPVEVYLETRGITHTATVPLTKRLPSNYRIDTDDTTPFLFDRPRGDTAALVERRQHAMDGVNLTMDRTDLDIERIESIREDSTRSDSERHEQILQVILEGVLEHEGYEFFEVMPAIETFGREFDLPTDPMIISTLTNPSTLHDGYGGTYSFLLTLGESHFHLGTGSATVRAATNWDALGDDLGETTMSLLADLEPGTQPDVDFGQQKLTAVTELFIQHSMGGSPFIVEENSEPDDHVTSGDIGITDTFAMAALEGFRQNRPRDAILGAFDIGVAHALETDYRVLVGGTPADPYFLSRVDEDIFDRVRKDPTFQDRETIEAMIAG